MDFKIGDTVQVKSGGPLLTVLETKDETVTCLYFSEEIGTFQRDSFPAFALEEVEIVEDDDNEPKSHASSEDDADFDDADFDDGDFADGDFDTEDEED